MDNLLDMLTLGNAVRLGIWVSVVYFVFTVVSAVLTYPIALLNAYLIVKRTKDLLKSQQGIRSHDNDDSDMLG